MATLPVLEHTSWPWAYALGQAGPAALLLPTAPGGLWLQAATPQAQAATAQAVQAVALHLLRHLPWQHLHVRVVDFGIRKRFAALAELHAHGLYHLLPDEPQARRTLDELEQLARHRHHQLLSDATPTLADYNQHAPRPEPYQLLVLNADDFPTDAQTTQRLATLLPEAAAAGVFVLAFSLVLPQAPTSDPTGRPLPPPDGPRLAPTLAALYPRVRVLPPGAAPDAPAGLELLGGPGTAELAAVLARHPVRLSLPPPALEAPLAELHARAHQEAGQSQEQDFLQVPVGTSLDGRSPVLWCMGARSACYNALMLGMPGSGKSTLLNNLIVGVAERYTAQQLRLYLMDYKDGVEFQAFAEHPNVERIFLDNEDTQAATTLLEEFQATIQARNERFKALKAQVRNLDDHNRLCPDDPLPRILLVVDEAQRLLAITDRRSQRFADLLVDVTRRGRSAGVHILLSTQSLDGVSDVNRLRSNISLRASFMLNNIIDAERVLDVGNAVPLSLKRFEFVLNPDNGRKPANQLARGLPTPDVFTRLAAVRAQRPAHLCITPVVQQAAQPLQAAPAASPQAAQPPAPAPSPAPSPAAAAAAAQDALEVDVLARLQRQWGITPDLPQPPEETA